MGKVCDYKGRFVITRERFVNTFAKTRERFVITRKRFVLCSDCSVCFFVLGLLVWFGRFVILYC